MEQHGTFAACIDAELADLGARGIDASTTPAQFEAYMAEASRASHGGHSLVARGLYWLQSASWIEAYGPERVLFVDSAELKDPAGAQLQVDRIFAAMGLPPHPLADATGQNVRSAGSGATFVKGGQPTAANRKGSTEEEAATLGRLRRFFAPFNKKLYAVLGRDLGWPEA